MGYLPIPCYREFPRANTSSMGIKRKKLRIGKKIPLASTNQKTTFIYKVELQSIIRPLELVSMKHFVEITNAMTSLFQ
jgi:hypothetical protein